jgi:hypothetical protein
VFQGRKPVAHDDTFGIGSTGKTAIPEYPGEFGRF